MERAVRYALLTLLVTSVHHAYGAYAYSTPWRLHVILIAAFTAAAIGGARSVLRRTDGGALRSTALWGFGVLTFVVPFALIGCFEGIYNHAAKILLFLTGVPTTTLLRLFPPPTYHLPDDFFFEVSGVMQIGPAMAAGYHLYRFLRQLPHRRVPRAEPSTPAIYEEAYTIDGFNIAPDASPALGELPRGLQENRDADHAD
jgi:hypothetical protein